MSLTEQQRMVLWIIDTESFAIRSRETLAADRKDMPRTMGLRDAFDSLVENGMIEPITEYRLTEAGRAALSPSPTEE